MMGGYYSILKFVNNSLSGENISIGLIVVSGDNVFFRSSKSKISIAQKLNPNSKKLLDFSLDKIENFIFNDLKDQDDKLVQFDRSLNVELLNRLSIYNNGVIQFSKPSFINLKFEQNTFNKFFVDFIDGFDINKEKKEKLSVFKEKLTKDLYNPLKEKIDVDYKLKKESLPTLFFDFHFDSIGVNGAIYASKGIDFNKQQLSDIRTELAEYESLIPRLKDFATSKGISGAHKYYIISDPYNGKSPSLLDIYTLLENKRLMSYFELIDSNHVNEIVQIVNDNNASRFSELLEI